MQRSVNVRRERLAPNQSRLVCSLTFRACTENRAGIVGGYFPPAAGRRQAGKKEFGCPRQAACQPAASEVGPWCWTTPTSGGMTAEADIREAFPL
jgi:hypothetical protein